MKVDVPVVRCTVRDTPYLLRFSLRRCIVCGAEPGQPCTVISGDEMTRPGSRRPEFHFYR